MRRGRRTATAALIVGLMAPAIGAGAARALQPPTPEPNFAATAVTSPCTATNQDETTQYTAEDPDYDAAKGRYSGMCQRLHFTYGPISIRPGQNDVVLSPISIEKPAYDGSLVRFAPNLVRGDGSVPPIEQLHLHHSVWLTADTLGTYGVPGVSAAQSAVQSLTDTREYGNGAFAASGEEKTVTNLPKGYGMPVKASDAWFLLYMIHNQQPTADNVWITYDIDYVPAGLKGTAQIRDAYPLWLDVRKGQTYPVFNVERRFGVNGECTWPDPSHSCAAGGPFGPVPSANNTWSLPAAGSSMGRIRNFQGGSLVWTGGHLHPGGKSDNIDLIRAGQPNPTRIFTSEAKYWNGLPTSWDLSMTVNYLPRWGVRVLPGDTFKITATYDTQYGSTYEDMGINIVFIAPDDAAGVDPFTATHSPSDTCSTPMLCERGVVTHGHLAEADNPGGSGEADPCPTPQNCTAKPTSTIAITGFRYNPGNPGTKSLTGIPAVKRGSGLTFENFDAAANVYHSITSCHYPCTSGGTGIAYPLADGSTSRGAAVDFDSGQLGYSPFNYFGNPVTPAKNSAVWTVTPDQTGLYTFFCRVHPFMRGVFEVTP